MLIAKLNACIGAFGKACALRKFSYLCTSLFIALVLSWPAVQRLRDSLYTTSVLADAANDQFWQYTPHVQPILKQPSSDMLAVYQVRITNPNNEPVTHELLARARDWQLGLTTFQVDLNNKKGHSLSLNDLPYFKLYSPFGTLWQYDEMIHDDWPASLNRYNSTSSSLDPLSVFENVTLDKHGKLVGADAIVLTALLLRNSDEHVWKTAIERYNEHMSPSWYIKQANAPAITWQYKFKILFPDYDIPISVYAFLLSHMVIFFIVSSAFGTTQLVKSRYGLGLAAVFTSITCVTVTLSILDRFGASLDAVPWYLFPLVSNVATLENSFLLTNAIVNAGCDMQVKEKVSRGLQSVGAPMIGTLMAELAILEIGRAMEVPMIKQFCLFAQVALAVEFCLEMTFFMAVLSIDINRAELADLDDRQVSKRLRELAISNVEDDQKQSPDFCPIQDSSEHTSCADCKDFKTHREVNALMLCMVILGLMMFQSYFGRATVPFCPPSSYHVDLKQQELLTKTERLRTVSTEYWDIINPSRETQWLRVEPPYLATFGMPATSTVESFEAAYRNKALSIQVAQSKRQPPSKLRSFVFTCARNTFLFLSSINVPSLVLCIVLVGILIWLTPAYRDQWLIPLFKKILLRVLNPSIISSNVIVRRLREHFRQDQEVIHVGAISAQEQYQKRNSSVGNVSIKTLSGQHVADVRRFDVNAKHGIVVSCGQDDRVVAWDTRRARPITQLRYDGDNGSTRAIPAKCVKIDQGNKWIAAALNNGMIWVWSACTGKVTREFCIERDYGDIQQPQQQVVFRNRRNNNNNSSSSSSSSNNGSGDPLSKKKRHLDRVLAVQFIGAVAEYCHPVVAEVAAKTKGHATVKSQNYLVTAHKSGMIREWDILSGECMQTVPSGHMRDISTLHVVEAKAPHRKLGVSWVFTASKDGRVTCWERQIVKRQDITSVWTCAYSIKGHDGHAITSIATELPVGGMGVLVTAASDRSVRVWNFETGAPVCTLAEASTKPAAAAVDSSAVISQLVVTRYCEVEKGRGMCRGCDTCFGNGFFIAASSTDGIVDVYRLERVGGSSHNGSCTLCSKDYHRSQYKRKKKSGDSGNNSNTTTSTPTRPPRRRQRHQAHMIPKSTTAASDGDNLLELLDIEQLAGDGEEIELVPTHLGKIDQPAGRGLAFCGRSRLLAGVRQKAGTHQWEAWFASLQYYDSAKDQERIPVETFDLDQDNPETEEELDSYFGLFGVDPQENTNGGNSSRRRRKDQKQQRQQQQPDEDYELLPFSTVHHVLPLDGTGLACDFGNFIKLIYLEDEHRKKHLPSCRCDACLKTRASEVRCSIIPNCPQASECLTARQQAV
ncbi:sterol-sensing domain of SREBP cleavage-activation-domain-containing protein [Zychaea mexicana]|uniref:sterol-sensing domain of SREBP cleavage-activation-domain-containing protein n=1 Tax=Zychaea mexicana TaxID=64656 RepID=UPI0022FF3EB4|nr:sterol-sensing domain of SREBP cleavage-activation-domain-containing protein [Zychaea mexicana]KAI9484324.1 sterol-sensing domain of SREBP cleavage-activation-domain-containing protein [Zychaea mexicana]